MQRKAHRHGITWHDVFWPHPGRDLRGVLEAEVVGLESEDIMRGSELRAGQGRAGWCGRREGLGGVEGCHADTPTHTPRHYLHIHIGTHHAMLAHAASQHSTAHTTHPNHHSKPQDTISHTTTPP